VNQEQNGTVDALEAMIRKAGLGEEAMAKLRKSLRKKKAKAVARTGPRVHCRKGDSVNVAFPDGVIIPMTVWHTGSMVLRLSTLSQEQLERRSQNLNKRLGRWRSEGYKITGKGVFKPGTPIPPIPAAVERIA
jgi:hypothetical protein